MGGLAARKNVGGMQLLRSSFKGRKYVVCRGEWVEMGKMIKRWREWKNVVNCPGKLAISGKRPGQNAKFYQSDGKIKPLPKEWQYFTW
jgi:hypothetical protein